MTDRYDLCLAWNWEHDAGFVELLATACGARDRSLLQVTPANVEAVARELDAGRLAFRCYLDRASETDPRFVRVVDWARAHGVVSINRYEDARRAWDKVAMHRELFSVVRTPYTIVLPSALEQPTLTGLDLTPLGPRFSIKPAHGGGGDGVVVDAGSLDEVAAARRQYPADEYLLQTRVLPASVDGRQAWFRMLYCAGDLHPCWWDVQSHVYARVTIAEELDLGLEPLRSTVASVARVCGLGLFSTEIALGGDGAFYVVDYANDPIDLRLQSRCREGVPDDVARRIAERLADVAGPGP